MYPAAMVLLLLSAGSHICRAFVSIIPPTAGRAVVQRQQHHVVHDTQLHDTMGVWSMRRDLVRLFAGAEGDAASLEQELEAIKPMRIKEIKAELDERGVGHAGLLEKEEFMQRLAEARVQGLTKPPPQPEAEKATTASASSTTSPQQSASSSRQASAAGKAKTESVEDRYQKALDEAMKLRISEIKKELQLLKVPYQGLMEKREFAEALAKARVAAGGSRASADDDDDPSEYRTVEVKRMPKEDKSEASQGAGPSATGGAGADFSDIFSRAQGGAGARGGPSGAGGFGSIFDMLNGMGGAGGMGGMGGMPGMGDIDLGMLQRIQSNPRAAAAFSRAQQNPKIMKAVQEMMQNPSAINKYANDPDIRDVLKELKSVIR